MRKLQDLGITLQQVEDAEHIGNYVDFLNPKTGTLYRMYCIFTFKKVDLSVFEENKKKDSEHVEKNRWGYFNTVDVICKNRVPLFCAKVSTSKPDDVHDSGKIYSTARIRYDMLKEKQFFKVLNL